MLNGKRKKYNIILKNDFSDFYRLFHIFEQEHNKTCLAQRATISLAKGQSTPQDLEVGLEVAQSANFFEVKSVS